MFKLHRIHARHPGLAPRPEIIVADTDQRAIEVARVLRDYACDVELWLLDRRGASLKFAK